jgi:tRNA pseudouridine55 synthase
VLLDGLLVVDKPIGPTSHDVVARVRRVLGERRIGHTGTLDPMASGVLPLVIGRATRLARFLDHDHKSYDALIRLGVSTDSYDAQGEPVGERYDSPLPSHEAIDRVLDRFRGTFWQQPPAFSAKKIEGRRSYALARDGSRRSLPAPVEVTAHLIDLVRASDDLVELRVVCSSGFYVRALAHDLGQALGVGAHLAALRRTDASGFTLAAAIPLLMLEDGTEGRAQALNSIIPLPNVLPGMPKVTLTDEGVRHAAHGSAIGPADVAGHMPDLSHAPGGTHAFIRLVTPEGELAAIAKGGAQGDVLHPVVVLM